MHSDSTLTLFIPELFGFQSILSTLSKQEFAQLPTIDLPVLEKWLSRSAKTPLTNSEKELFSYYHLTDKSLTQHSYAALSLLAENNIDIKVEENAFWMRADPVYLQADRDAALLLAHEELELTQDEANKLAHEINEHFVDEPWQLHAVTPHRWYLKIDSTQHFNAPPLVNVLGNNIDDFKPSGADVTYWHKIINEIQMLLHGTSINFERDSRGQLTANSLWLWGGGSLPNKSHEFSYSKIISDELHLAGLAKHHQIESLHSVAKFEESALCALNTLAIEVQRNDVYTFIEKLNAIENDIFSKIQHGLDTGNIKTIRIVCNNEFVIEITKKQLARWWKRIKPYSTFKYA